MSKKIEIGDIVRIKSGTSVNEEVLVDSFSRGSGGGTMVFGKWRWNDPAQGGGSVLGRLMMLSSFVKVT